MNLENKMNPNSDEVVYTMMIISLEKKIKEQELIIKKQSDLISGLGNVIDTARKRQEIADNYIKTQKLLIDLLEKKANHNG